MQSTVTVSGFFDDEPNRTFSTRVCLGSWDGVENDENVFFYMDGMPLRIGSIIAGNFVVTEIGA